ncbi:MAG: phosphoglycerate mutase (2,3-diphosphoglycerate-independent) [Polyangiaceae bacterium UTPRO1]|jgi:2,3-bisphosphoglycerate-independent phosphoglycerate mutase|nr:2,3-bisphosphoglycerate-independent phosphoglycerate mutase [Myxococcales bacterium]OQY65094.1 MAG: phosphoglycerate mutase (2,3-diphosphoglycerate-independent) [Polyangiaceae bacterium UTPRO1]
MRAPIVLVIRDGWGIGRDYPGNAVALARPQVLAHILATYPHTVLGAAGRAVGLRPGYQGSSEVGHLNIGAGRIVEQEIVRVDKLIESGELFRHPALLEVTAHCKQRGSALHFMGLLQDQGVHATEEHLYALLELARRQELKRVFVHVFADGRDTPPRSALTYIDRLEGKMRTLGVGAIASVMGRYYAMDRALNWDRIERAYDCMVHGKGLLAPSAKAAIEKAYARADATLAARAAGTAPAGALVESDEFVQPTLVAGSDGRPLATIRPGDGVVHFNYRQDRAIQLTQAFVDDGFTGFARGPRLDVVYRGLTRYYDEFPYAVLPPMNMDELVGEVVSKAGMWQLRIAEYQKYRHVTSFFNGKRLAPYPGEDRILVPSTTLTEDQKPEMSAYEVTELAEVAIRDGIAAARARTTATPGCELEVEPSRELSAERGRDTYDLIVLNYANCDMVGHTGVLDAAVRAVAVTDECIGKVIAAARARNGTVIVTSDHGNAEQMLDPDTGAVQTAHTTNDVECVLVSDARRTTTKLRPHGVLADIGPTLLELLGLPVPPPMTAQSLIDHG